MSSARRRAAHYRAASYRARSLTGLRRRRTSARDRVWPRPHRTARATRRGRSAAAGAGRLPAAAPEAADRQDLIHDRFQCLRQQNPDRQAFIARAGGSHLTLESRSGFSLGLGYQRLRNPQWTFHFTPTSASWLNTVEGCFATLTKRRLKRGVYRSVVKRQAAINCCLEEHNQPSRRFTWTADPDKVIAAVRSGHQMADSMRYRKNSTGRLGRSRWNSAVDARTGGHQVESIR